MLRRLSWNPRYADEAYYDGSNAENAEKRKQFFHETLDELKMYLIGGGQGKARVAILDGSNHSRDRREEVNSS